MVVPWIYTHCARQVQMVPCPAGGAIATRRRGRPVPASTRERLDCRGGVEASRRTGGASRSVRSPRPGCCRSSARSHRLRGSGRCQRHPDNLSTEDYMATKIVDTILPTTMVGSYPRPHWFKHQLLGRDIRVAFKEVQHEEAYDDAVATVIRDQEEAGLDIVTDGNMWYDDYVGVIGSFCWYMYERSEEHTSELQSRL